MVENFMYECVWVYVLFGFNEMAIKNMLHAISKDVSYKERSF